MCSSDLCAPFQKMVAGLLADPRNPVNPTIQTSVMWINDGATLNAGWFSTEGVDFTASYDFDLGDYGAWNTGIVGTYYMSQISANFTGRADVPSAGLASDILYHTNIAAVGGLAQNGIESLPRLRYRARLGWTDGTWSVITFMDYQSHFFHTQNAPPSINGQPFNNQCVVAGGTVSGGTNPCQIFGYTNIEPSYYTFDLSLGYDTGETPANDYLKHVNVNVVIQNLFDKKAPFEYRIGTGGGNPCACDITKSIQGRTIGVTLTKTW